MAQVIKNAALIQCLQCFGLTPEEFRTVMRTQEPQVPQRDPAMQELLNYLSDTLQPKAPDAEFSE